MKKDFATTGKYINLSLSQDLTFKQKINLACRERGIDTVKINNNEIIKSNLEWLEKSNNNHVVHFNDPNYPLQLKQINNPPLVLFCQGNIKLMHKNSLAIIGSRTSSYYSNTIAKEFTKYFSMLQVPIISGLAKGIDAVAGNYSVENNPGAIAVIGTGLDITYPMSNNSLQNKIAKQGLLISEYPLGTPPLKHNFPQRNRIISALAMGVCVVEAKLRSGSLITAKLALDYGKEVFVIPGPINNSAFWGSHKLIQEGAKLVQEPQDILDELPFLQK